MSSSGEPLDGYDEPRPRKRWTRAEYAVLVRKGFVPPDSGYELIDGDVIDRTNRSDAYAVTCARLVDCLAGVFGADYVRLRSPLALSDRDEPAPDVTVTAEPAQALAEAGMPTAADVRLIVEIGDVTLLADRTIKATVYGRSGIPEYWVVDSAGRQLFVHRVPGPNGYSEVFLYSSDETLSPLSAPDSSLKVADILP